MIKCVYHCSRLIHDMRVQTGEKSLGGYVRRLLEHISTEHYYIIVLCFCCCYSFSLNPDNGSACYITKAYIYSALVLRFRLKLYHIYYVFDTTNKITAMRSQIRARNSRAQFTH